MVGLWLRATTAPSADGPHALECPMTTPDPPAAPDPTRSGFRWNRRAAARESATPAASDVENGARGKAGVVGNERLTALAGAVLLVLFAIEIITVVPLRSLISLHFLVGVLLIGPVVVKIVSASWRFLRYYTRHPAYRRKGPPQPVMRALAPLLLASTVAVLGSGVALAVTGPAPLILLQIHLISFLVWLVVVVIHVAVYLGRVPKLLADDWRRRPPPQAPVPGRRARLVANIVALAAAAIAAVFLLPTAARWSGWFSQSVAGPGVVAVIFILVAVVAVWRRATAGRAR